MEQVPTRAHLAIDVDIGGLSSLFPYDADSASCSRLAFDGCALFCATHHRLWFVSRVRLGVLCYAPPPPVVRVRWMHRPPHLVSRDRCGCAVVTTTFIPRLRPRSMGAGYPSAYRSRLAFDRRVLWQSPPPPTVRVSHSMSVCCANHHLRLIRVSFQWVFAVHLPPSSASRFRWAMR